MIENWDGSEVQGEGGERQQEELLASVIALAETILAEDSPQDRIYGRVKPLRYLLGPGLPPIVLKDTPSVALVSSLIPARIQITFGLFYQPAGAIYILLMLTKGDVVVRVAVSKCSQAVGVDALRVTGPTSISMDLPNIVEAMKQNLDGRHAARVAESIVQQEVAPQRPEQDQATIAFKVPIPVIRAAFRVEL